MRGPHHTGEAGGPTATTSHDLAGLELVESGLQRLVRVDVDLVDPDELGELVRRLQTAANRLAAVTTKALGALDRRRAYTGDGHRDTGSWVGEQLHVRPGQARRQARTARRLRRLPATTQALENGEISPEHAQVLADTVGDPHRPVDPDVEAALVEMAKHTDPTRLARQARRRVVEQEPDRARERGRRAWDGRRLRRRVLTDGSVAYDVVADPRSAELIDAALEALVHPEGSEVPADQRRSIDQRRHDALVELARRALSSGQLPEVGGLPVTGLVIVDADTLTHDHDRSDGQPSDAARYAAWLGTGEPVDATTARRLLCDAWIVRVVCDPDTGRITAVDVPRPAVSHKLRRAVIARDRACRRCGAPARWCEVHHITHQQHGGTHEIDNLILLCWTCHHGLHETGWTATLHPDDAATFHGPHGQQVDRPPPGRQRRRTS